MSWNSFRVKIDLSSLYHDSRRHSWVYIVQFERPQIRDLEKHVAQVFGIKEPFHLLINGNEYLPPVEDIRIIKETDVLVVLPGTGHWSHVSDRFTPCGNSSQRSIEVELLRPSETQIIKSYVPEKAKEEQDVVPEKCESMQSSTVESKTDDDCVIEDVNIVNKVDVQRKRKRTRRSQRKKTSNNTSEPPLSSLLQQQLKKPTIIDSVVIPSGKHTRFDNDVSENGTSANDEDMGPSEKIRTLSERSSICENGSASSKDLSVLLSLQKSSQPLTFTSKSDKKDVKSKDTSNGPSQDSGVKEMELTNNIPVKDVDISSVNPQSYPIMKSIPQLNDIISFKILKMGNDYTPQCSNFVIGKVTDFHPTRSSCTFQILKGKSELETPKGKFALPDDLQPGNEIETVTFYTTQLIEPRLLKRD
ncbi:uncharacterized protein LOC105694396 [Orussus abietinus]|uniref:uncharacterized protein LOC105694396 n=1 Tax=Orussus abietinus TaxID=222816 RepID=UPI0006252FE0|nr:uncharacterized protein LOC105694396 [Orussus abietinus]